MELGFGVYISEIGFRCFVFWESGVDVEDSSARTFIFEGKV